MSKGLILQAMNNYLLVYLRNTCINMFFGPYQMTYFVNYQFKMHIQHTTYEINHVIVSSSGFFLINHCLMASLFKTHFQQLHQAKKCDVHVVPVTDLSQKVKYRESLKKVPNFVWIGYFEKNDGKCSHCLYIAVLFKRLLKKQ